MLVLAFEAKSKVWLSLIALFWIIGLLDNVSIKYWIKYCALICKIFGTYVPITGYCWAEIQGTIGKKNFTIVFEE